MSVGWDQTFAFDRAALSMAHREIVREPGLSTAERHEQLPYGKNKVDGYLNYLSRLGLYDKETFSATSLGAIIAEEDPGWQDEGTRALLQMQIACEPTASVWYEMTHNVLPTLVTFTKAEAHHALLARPEIQAGSLDNAKEDFGRYVRALTEEDALGRLRLLSVLDLPNGVRYRRVPSAYAPSLLLAYGIYRQRAQTAPGTRSMSLQTLMGPGGVGRALHLHLDVDGFADRIRPLRTSDILGYTQTANLQDVEFLQPEADPLEFVRAYYDEV